MEATLEQKLFDSFCLCESKIHATEKKYLSKPFLNAGYVYATDYHRILSAKVGIFDIQAEKVEFHNDIQAKFFNKPDDQYQELELDFEKWKEFRVIQGYKYSGDYIKCESCEGSGVVTWTFDNHEKEDCCPVCNGIGFSQTPKRIKTGECNVSENSIAIIGEAFLNGYLLDSMVSYAENSEQKIEFVFPEKNNEPVNFKVGKIYISVMPIITSTFDTHQERLKELMLWRATDIIMEICKDENGKLKTKYSKLKH